MKSYDLVVDWLGRPLLVNAMTSMVPMARHTHRKEWRFAGAQVFQMAKLPKMTRASFEVRTRYPNRRSLPDPAGCEPAFKSLLDGLVDARLLPNDTGEHVMWIRFWPPLVEPGLPALLVTVTDRSDG